MDCRGKKVQWRQTVETISLRLSTMSRSESSPDVINTSASGKRKEGEVPRVYRTAGGADNMWTLRRQHNVKTINQSQRRCTAGVSWSVLSHFWGQDGRKERVKWQEGNKHTQKMSECQVVHYMLCCNTGICAPADLVLSALSRPDSSWTDTVSLCEISVCESESLLSRSELHSS